MRNRPGGHEVSASLRVSADRIERDIARQLNFGAASDVLNFRGGLLRCQVIQKYMPGSRGQSFIQFLTSANFDLHWDLGRELRPGDPFQRGPYASSGRNVIVLNKHGIKQPETVVCHSSC